MGRAAYPALSMIQTVILVPQVEFVINVTLDITLIQLQVSAQ